VTGVSAGEETAGELGLLVSPVAAPQRSAC